MIAGLLGVGGGIILVPILTANLHLTQHRAHGTSLTIIIPIALVGTIVYALRGDTDWVLVIIVGLGSVVGVYCGAKLMMKVPAHRLRQVFGIYTIAVAILLFLR